MEESGGGGGPLILASLLALIVAASGIYVFQEPLESSRPEVEGLKMPQPRSRIRARLWQDPIRVAREAWNDSGRDAKRSTLKSGNPGEPLVVLAVSLPADTSILSQEQRLRHRYAVWAGLDTLGFEAVDGSHLSYAVVGGRSPANVKTNCKLASSDSPLFIYEEAKRSALNASPFELLPKSARGKRKAKGSTDDGLTADQIRSARNVVVLWTEDRLFDENPTPIKCIKAVVESLGASNRKVAIRVVGPNSSDTLREIENVLQDVKAKTKQMAAEGLTDGNDDETKPYDADFFSPMATADDVFFGADSGQDTDDFLASERLTRTIASDLELTNVLVDELRNHRIRLPEPRRPRKRERALS